jgi:hypothetical protein
MLAIEQRGGYHRWMCRDCGQRGRRWYLTEAEAKDAGREHEELSHPAVSPPTPLRPAG